MKRLTQDQFFKAVDFIMTNARPLDKKLFEYFFWNGSSLAVMNELSRYQNTDGGCGHGIEPDIRMAVSSPVSTSVAMQYACMVKTPLQHPFIKRAMQYFTSVFEENGKWPLVLPEMNNEPHADWWHYTGQTDEGFETNPGAEITGYYHAYPQILRDGLLGTLHDHVFQYIENTEGVMEFHEVLSYLRLAEVMPEPGKSMLTDQLRKIAPNVVTTNPEEWDGYCAKPLWLAPSPASPLYSVLKNNVELNLDYEIDNQAADGSWHPFWEWGQFREVWENEAKKEWQGWLTVKTLLALHSFGRIDEKVTVEKRS
ncbi:hypothetical protein K8O68_08925 [Salipaludibacillus sp. CUR1]|uniref:hypothetical protein n=1 Tax=Salipaludibacillus sp. CUR1 TaxID=2820003 RepID=UPI001E2CC1CD|nr:hypothetical protein [Salipaludibacillus sp. CUR1]MCE7792538.1 hypothetical protein [Salipaludibacillus sp. CUR1]